MAVSFHPTLFVIALLLLALPALAMGLVRRDGHGHGRHRPTAAPMVTLDYITLAGNSRAGYHEFLGIPYAQPPLGQLRWMPPQAPQQYTNVYNATKYTMPCLQTPNNIIAQSSEDCLYLHVWTPAGASASSQLPVFVWIHGGGFFMDAAQSYPGEHVIEGQGLETVVVTLDYRLGAFGFLATDALFAEGHANFGLLDQEFALQWVQKYISAFGGNPNHVTVFGESAGAGSVALQMIMRGGANALFHRAILESGSFTTHHETPSLADQAAATQALAASTGCHQSSPAAQLACFRQADAQTILNTNGRFWPVVDGVLFADLPNKLVARGLFMRVPALFGTNTNEGAGFTSPTVTQAQLPSAIRSRLPQLSPANISTLLDSLYPAWMFPSSHLRAAEVMGDEMMACVSEAFASARADAGVPTYRYRFNHAPENSYSAPVSLVAHATELPLVFNGTTYQGLEPAEQSLVSKIMGSWKAFGLNADPSTPGDPVWPQWDSTQRRHMVLDYAYAVEAAGDNMPAGVHARRCAFWAEDFASADSSRFWPPQSLSVSMSQPKQQPSRSSSSSSRRQNSNSNLNRKPKPNAPRAHSKRVRV